METETHKITVEVVGNNDLILRALPSYYEAGYKQASNLTFEGNDTVVTLTKTVE